MLSAPLCTTQLAWSVSQPAISAHNLDRLSLPKYVSTVRETAPHEWVRVPIRSVELVVVSRARVHFLLVDLSITLNTSSRARRCPYFRCDTPSISW
ncbi:hypothetical protein PLICRDRAFT_243323 [Plicaturopsis crispa FD-325 SS-3]|nr:hypothetical protein PLICRDRAFT_243323 [Plicaturopsis crispa FD-325 SS-3]